MPKTDPIVIIGSKRTPIGAFQGILSGLTSPQLGGIAINATLQMAKISPEDIEEVYMGCVLTAALGQAPARQAALFANLPQRVPCTLINKVCGSGMKAIMMACADLKERPDSGVMLAGGMESMTNSPYLLRRARAGYRMGHYQIYDHMLLDGLEDAYEPGRLMGTFAEDTAAHYGFTRAQQDDFAAESARRTFKAIEDGVFDSEILSISVGTDNSNALSKDETPSRVKVEKIPHLKPAFKKDGTITAASSSSLADGAATLALARLSTAEKRGYKPLAVIRGYVSYAQAPSLFTSAPVGAIQKLQKQINWTMKEVDLFEINEAFAVVTMVAMKELSIPHERVNVYGGACALGHPIGASGARVLVTLLNALEKHKKKKGIASLCIGGGEGVAMAIERM